MSKKPTEDKVRAMRKAAKAVFWAANQLEKEDTKQPAPPGQTCPFRVFYHGALGDTIGKREEVLHVPTSPMMSACDLALWIKQFGPRYAAAFACLDDIYVMSKAKAAVAAEIHFYSGLPREHPEPWAQMKPRVRIPARSRRKQEAA